MVRGFFIGVEMTNDSIKRIKEKTKGFSIISNEIFTRSDVSARAKGLYAYIMTLPDNWKIFKFELFSHFSEGINAMDTAFKELEKLGYVHKEHVKNDKGHFTGWEYTVFESVTNLEKTNRMENHKLDIHVDGNKHVLSTNGLTTEKKLTTNKKEALDFSFLDHEPIEYKQAFLQFVDYRKESKNPMSQTSINALARKLSAYTIRERISAIEQSIASGWKGVFPNDKFRKQEVVKQAMPGSVRPTHCDRCGKPMVTNKCECGRQLFSSNNVYAFEDPATISLADVMKGLI